ncbi:MAG: hypothetical protein PVI26_14695 [Chitinispirillia bacterium]|jgi:hypothetical protein
MYSVSDDEHFIYLKNGDITPDFLGAHSQTSIKDLLRENNFLDSSETYVVLKHNELLLCAELSNLGDWNDYQDIVLFLTFGATTNDSTTQSQEFIISSTGQQSNGIEETIEVMLKKMGNGHLEVLSWREIN